MSQEGVAAVNDMGNGVDLMGQQRDLRVDAGENDAAPVILAGADRSAPFVPKGFYKSIIDGRILLNIWRTLSIRVFGRRG